MKILKHAFIEYWLTMVIQNYKKRKSNSSELTDKLTDKSVTILLKVNHENDVNRWFGWDVFKLKKKYKRFIKQGVMNNIYEEN